MARIKIHYFLWKYSRFYLFTFSLLIYSAVLESNFLFTLVDFLPLIKVKFPYLEQLPKFIGCFEVPSYFLVTFRRPMI